MRGPSPTPRRALVVALVTVAFAAVLGQVACGTDPVGVDACRRIERTRCESAPACNISLDRQPHSGDSAKSDVAACIRFYDDQCLHGMSITKEPSPQQVDACVNAIISGDCSVVKTPESHPDCSWLVPPAAPAPSDASSDAPADASTDG